MSDISLSQLLEAGVHFGHKAHRWNPKMFPYIYSEVNNIHILDLIQSATLLKKAMRYLEVAASKDQKVLFIGTKRQATTLIAQEAKRSNSYYVNHRWLGGMLTNWVTLKSRIERLKTLEKQEADQVFELLPKKFTLSQLQRLYEIIMGTEFEKRNFRRKILKKGILIPLEEKQVGVPHKAARLYQFDKEGYERAKGENYSFTL